MPFGKSMKNMVSAAQGAARSIAGQMSKNSPRPVTAAVVPAIVNRAAGMASRLKFKDGGSVSSGRGDGCAVRGKTKCKMY